MGRPFDGPVSIDDGCYASWTSSPYSRLSTLLSHPIPVAFSLSLRSHRRGETSRPAGGRDVEMSKPRSEPYMLPSQVAVAKRTNCSAHVCVCVCACMFACFFWVSVCGQQCRLDCFCLSQFKTIAENDSALHISGRKQWGAKEQLGHVACSNRLPSLGGQLACVDERVYVLQFACARWGAIANVLELSVGHTHTCANNHTHKHTRTHNAHTDTHAHTQTHTYIQTQTTHTYAHARTRIRTWHRSEFSVQHMRHLTFQLPQVLHCNFPCFARNICGSFPHHMSSFVVSTSRARARARALSLLFLLYFMLSLAR